MKRIRSFAAFSLPVLALLIVLAIPRLAVAAETTCNDSTGMHLPAGDAATDLMVTGPCEVKAGTYTFHNVNVVKTAGVDCTQQPANCGSLSFDDDPSGIDFFAESILIENGGSLIAGSSTTPIGTNCSGGAC